LKVEGQKVKNRSIGYGAIPLFIVLAMALAGCSGALPPDARETVLSTFEPDEKPHIDSAKQVEPLPEDLETGAEEVWCVNLTFACWSCSRGEWHTCADSRLVRRIHGNWQVSVALTEEDKEKWEARGCKLMPDTVSGY
jgi:hypothetical protein